ncbi:MAG: hypothetical protein ACRCWM_02010 [Sarcina sp.]
MYCNCEKGKNNLKGSGTRGSENKNNCSSTKDKYMKSDNYFNTSKETKTNNHYVRNNHYNNTNHHYVKDFYYVNDFYYNKDVYYYDREVIEKSFDCGSETIVDPNSGSSKPIPYHCDCDYEEVSKEEFYNSFKCKTKCECDCNHC